MVIKLQTRTVMHGDEPAVRQPDVNGWEISYNPDNKRWYVHHPTNEDFGRNYAHQRNAVYYARTHNINEVK